MRRRAPWFALLVALVTGFSALAAVAQKVEIPSPVLTVDQDRLFAESAFGRRAIAEIDARSRALAAENRKIETELIAEERALTELRPTLPAEEFRTRADAFDAKVQRLRAEQDEKERALGQLREEAQSRFFGQIGPILADVVRDRGAVAILDRRAVLLSLAGIDITEAAIARIDAVLGDGSNAPDAPVPEASPPDQAGGDSPDVGDEALDAPATLAEPDAPAPADSSAAPGTGLLPSTPPEAPDTAASPGEATSPAPPGEAAPPAPPGEATPALSGETAPSAPSGEAAPVPSGEAAPPAPRPSSPTQPAPAEAPDGRSSGPAPRPPAADPPPGD